MSSTPIPGMPGRESLALYGRLLSYLKPLWPVAIITIIGFTMFASTNAWFAYLTGQLVDTIEQARDMDAVERMRIPLLLVLLAATRGFGGYLIPWPTLPTPLCTACGPSCLNVSCCCPSVFMTAVKSAS